MSASLSLDQFSAYVVAEIDKAKQEAATDPKAAKDRLGKLREVIKSYDRYDEDVDVAKIDVKVEEVKAVVEKEYDPQQVAQSLDDSIAGFASNAENLKKQLPAEEEKPSEFTSRIAELEQMIDKAFPPGQKAPPFGAKPAPGKPKPKDDEEDDDKKKSKAKKSDDEFKWPDDLANAATDPKSKWGTDD